jgi:hypothetical protein
MSQSNVQVPAPTSNFRIIATSPPPNGICPTYLAGPVGSRYLYSMAIIYDGLNDAAGYAVRARFPNYAPSDAYPWLAQDRQIFQGATETSTSYVARMIQWLDLWRHSGSSTGVLLGVLATMSPNMPQVLAVSSTGAGEYSSWDTYAAGVSPFPAGQTNPTPPAHYLAATANFDWDGSSQPYYYPWVRWRKWVVIFSISGSPWPAPTATWASGGSLNVAVVNDATYGTKYQNQSPASAGGTSCNWGDGTCWGWAGTAAQASALSQAVGTWKSAGCWYPWIVVTYDATTFDQSQAFGSAKLPNGLWGYNGRIVSDSTYGTKYLSARYPSSTATFIAGPVEAPGVLGLG